MQHSGRLWIYWIRFNGLNFNNMENEITIHDIILKELNLIQNIYNLQITERYLSNIEIRSKTPFFNLESFRFEITKRYGSTQNTNLLNKELDEIRKKSCNVINFYNQNLTDNTIIGKNYNEQLNEISYNEKSLSDFMKYHSVLIFDEEFNSLYGVLFGCHSKFRDKDTYIPIPPNYKFSCFCNNEQLALFCRELIINIDYFLNTLSGNTTTRDELQLTIPENVLNWLQETKCSCREIKRNNKPFIEDANVKPLKWMQNKQILRELLTHNKIRGKLKDAEIVNQTPSLFVDINNNPIRLSKDKHNPNDPNSDQLATFLDSI